jgi:uncharacterized protein YndB with AHSA1/START domain
MPAAENSVTIDRPIQQVFDLLADGTNNPKWRPGVLEIANETGGFGVGTVYKQAIRGPGGRRIAGTIG